MVADTNPSITVVGGGMAGCLAAIVAAKQGYNVTLFEREDQVLKGASMIASRLHLGGEYPLDFSLKSGEDCLTGAMVFRLLMPEVYTPVPPMRFTVTNASEADGRLSVERYIQYYKHLQEQYTEHFEHIRSAFGWSREVAAERLFGAPEDFFRRLQPDELSDLAGVSGGFISQERGIDIPLTGAFLVEALERYEVRVHTHANVKSIRARSGGGYDVSVEGKGSPTHTDAVVQAAWHRGFDLDASLRPQDRPIYGSAFLRTTALVDISRIDPQSGPTFAMEGASGGLYCPYNENVAVIYHPGTETAYREEQPFGTGHAPLPHSWEDRMRQTQEADLLSRYIEMLANGPYPFLADAEGIRLVTRPTLSFQSDLHQRQHRPTEVLAPGYVVCCPTKVTLAALSAIEALHMLDEHFHGKVNGTAFASVPVDTLASLSMTGDPLPDGKMMQRFAEDRELPVSLVNSQRMKFPRKPRHLSPVFHPR